MGGQAVHVGRLSDRLAYSPRACGHLSKDFRGVRDFRGWRAERSSAGELRSTPSRSRLAGLLTLPKLRGTAFGHGPASFQFSSAASLAGGRAAAASTQLIPPGGGSHQLVHQGIHDFVDWLPEHQRTSIAAVAVCLPGRARFGFDGIAAASSQRNMSEDRLTYVPKDFAPGASHEFR